MTDEEIKALVASTVKESAPDVKTLVGDLLKPFQTAIEDLTKNQKVLADTYAADKSAAEEAAKKSATDTSKTPEALTVESAGKLFTDLLTKHTQAQQQSAAQSKAISDFIASAESGLSKIAPFASALGFDVASQLTGDKEKDLAKAKQIVAGWEKYAADNKIVIPDVGGAARDGGNAAGAGGGAEAAAKPGSWIKIAN